ncbi:hypothetical protein CsSME_00010041 [Camellia sinensis var. sinensis]
MVWTRVSIKGMRRGFSSILYCKSPNLPTIKRDSLVWYSYIDPNVSCLSLFPEDRFTESLTCITFANQRSYKSERPHLGALCISSQLNTSMMQGSLMSGYHNTLVKWLHARCMSSTSIELKMENDVVRFSLGKLLEKKGSPTKGQKRVKRVKMSKKAKLNELRLYRLKAKKKMKSPNPEVRIRYKLEKAKRKEAWLIEKLRNFEVPKAPAETYDPEILTEEEKFYLKRTGEKKKNYVPVGRRGVFGGVVLNMHLHWKKHETVKVICKPCKPGQVHEYAEDLARLSKGIVIDIKPNNTIIFYRGKNYVQPKVMSPPDTLSKAKALEKYRFEQSLEHTSQFIEKLEKELEEYHKHLARTVGCSPISSCTTLPFATWKKNILVKKKLIARNPQVFRGCRNQYYGIESRKQAKRDEMGSNSVQNLKKLELDCQLIHRYILGNVASNKQSLAEILLRNSQELKLLCQTYRALYNQDLRVTSKAQRSNLYFRAAYFRISEPQECDAEMMRNSLYGGSVNLNTLIEIACTRSSSELQAIKQAYSSLYNSNIDQDVALKVNGGFKEILLAILKSCRNYGVKANPSMAMCDAKTLYEAMESGKMIDQKTIVSLISQRNTSQVRAILVAYKQLYGHEFAKSLKRSKCGQFGKELRIVIRCIQYPERFFAKQLRMKNGDARELLIRIVITRCDLDVKEVSRAYAAKTGISLESLVRKEFNNGKDNANAIVAEILVRLIKGC